jgi:deoxycytidine triphosphate deaminase
LASASPVPAKKRASGYGGCPDSGRVPQDGRSTVARLGVTIHITASVIDETFETPHVAVLEIKNVGNFKIRLNFKDPVAMMLFAELKDPVRCQALVICLLEESRHKYQTSKA